MISLSVPNIKGKEWSLVKECLDSNWVSSAGKFVEKFEEEIARYVKADYSVACVNGTAGLFLSLKLLGINAGDEVIVPTVTFIAPVNTVKYLGAHPVFMDCDNYLNLDVAKLEEFCRKECSLTKKGLKNKKSNRTIKAILPVHVFGNPCDMAEIMAVARRYRLKVIEDATESLGAYYTEGIYKNRFTGTIGDFGVYSFNGNKIITTGSGGMIVTGNKKLARNAKYLANQAKDDPFRSIHHEIGYNLRLNNMQAALGLAQLEKLSSFIKVKKKNYEIYKDGLMGVDGIEVMDIPEGSSPNYWFYSLLVDKAKYGLDIETLSKKLLANKIETRPLWYLSHRQRPFRGSQTYKIKKAFWFWQRVLNVPCSSSLTRKEIDTVVALIKKYKR
jgi:perosamine synthetase